MILGAPDFPKADIVYSPCVVGCFYVPILPDGDRREAGNERDIVSFLLTSWSWELGGLRIRILTRS